MPVLVGWTSRESRLGWTLTFPIIHGYYLQAINWSWIYFVAKWWVKQIVVMWFMLIIAKANNRNNNNNNSQCRSRLDGIWENLCINSLTSSYISDKKYIWDYIIIYVPSFLKTSTKREPHTFEITTVGNGGLN